jgi:hypothetical protein
MIYKHSGIKNLRISGCFIPKEAGSLIISSHDFAHLNSVSSEQGTCPRGTSCTYHTSSLYKIGPVLHLIHHGLQASFRKSVLQSDRLQMLTPFSSLPVTVDSRTRMQH